jgi:hypothetical protein
MVSWPNMVLNTCNPRNKEAEAGGLQVQGQPSLHSDILLLKKSLCQTHFSACLGFFHLITPWRSAAAFFFFFERVFCSPGWPQTGSSCLSLPSAGVCICMSSPSFFLMALRACCEYSHILAHLFSGLGRISSWKEIGSWGCLFYFGTWVQIALHWQCRVPATGNGSTFVSIASAAHMLG